MVDTDPVALAYTRADVVSRELAERVAVVHADVRDTGDLLARPEVKRLLHPDEPTAVICTGVFDALPDADDPPGVARRLLGGVGAGSLLAVSHWVSESELLRSQTTDFLLAATGGHFGRIRRTSEVAAWLAGFEVLEPGVVPAARWWPEAGDTVPDYDWDLVAAVARRP